MKLIGQQKGFEIGSTVHACTKGIFVWSQPVMVQRGGEHVPVVLIDTEGLSSFSADGTRDAEILSLAMLLSSYCVYNRLGTIDEAALDRLSLMAHLSERISVSAKASKADDAQQLALAFPLLHVVLRDFTLELVDEGGQPISDSEYLEMALRTRSKDKAKNEIRSALRTFFPSRDCTTLPRPVDAESKLRHVDDLPESALRPEFRQAMANLRQRVMGTAPVKRVQGHTLTGPAFVELMAQYVASINAGGVPCIGSAWAAVSGLAAQQALEDALALFVEGINKAVTALPMDPAQLATIHSRCVGDALALFDARALASESASACRAKLLKRLDEERTRLNEKNDAEAAQYSKKQLTLLTDRLEERVRSGALATVDAVLDAWNELAATYIKLGGQGVPHMHRTLVEGAYVTILPRTVARVAKSEAAAQAKRVKDEADALGSAHSAGKDAQIAALTKQVHRLEEDAAEAERRLKRAQGDKDAATTALEREGAARAAAKNAQDSEIATLKAQLRQLQSALEDANNKMASSLKQLQDAEKSETAALNARVRQLQSSLDAAQSALAAERAAPRAAPESVARKREEPSARAQPMDVDGDDHDDNNDDEGGAPAAVPSARKPKKRAKGDVDDARPAPETLTIPAIKKALMDAGVMPARDAKKPALVAQLKEAWGLE